MTVIEEQNDLNYLIWEKYKLKIANSHYLIGSWQSKICLRSKGSETNGELWACSGEKCQLDFSLAGSHQWHSGRAGFYGPVIIKWNKDWTFTLHRNSKILQKEKRREKVNPWIPTQPNVSTLEKQSCKTELPPKMKRLRRRAPRDEDRTLNPNQVRGRSPESLLPPHCHHVEPPGTSFS